MNSKGISQIINSIQGFISHAEYMYNGQTYTEPIWKYEPSGSNIRILVFLNNAEVNGNITKVALVDNNGDIVDEKVDIYVKDEKGLFIAFDYVIKVKG